jgi:hypothetical protein
MLIGPNSATGSPPVPNRSCENVEARTSEVIGKAGDTIEKHTREMRKEIHRKSGDKTE